MSTAMETRNDREMRSRKHQAGEAWIDALDATLHAEARIYTMGLRYCRRAFVTAIETSAQVATAASELATSTVAAFTTEAMRTERQAAEKMTETMAERQEPRRSRRRQPANPNGMAMLSAEALEAFTVEQLDRLARTQNVDDYPNGGSKSEKTETLAAWRIDLDALSVEMLDHLAEANGVDDYPQSGTKREKIAALSDMLPSMTR